MKAKIEITLDDIKEFIKNSNQFVRDEIISELNTQSLPNEYRNETVRVIIPPCTNRDGSIRKGSVSKMGWETVKVKNDDIETIIEKEIFPSWDDIENEIEDNIGEWSDKFDNLFDTYKDNNTFIVKAKSLNDMIQLEELLKGF